MLPRLTALLPALVVAHVAAQNVSTTVITSQLTRTVTSSQGRQTFTTTIVTPTTISSTITFTPTPSSTTSDAPTATTTSPPQIKLDTKLDPAFGVLGAVLILTGLPSAFLGHKNRWSSYFLTGFYTLSGICLALILKFGVLAAVNPPNKALRGLFVLSCSIAGLAGGAVCVLFWNYSKYFVGALGGLAFGLWIQCFRNGGVIRQIGFRWILYIGCSVVGFVLCTIPKIHYHVLLVSTAMVGATAFMLGVDCYTLVNLKEFYVYNLGFSGLFPKYANTPFPVTQVMQIELGLIAATAIAGIAIQMRVLALLQIKLKQIKLEQKRRDREVEARAAERFAQMEKDRQLWERDHGRSASAAPLMKPPSPSESVGTPGGLSDDTLIGRRGRMQSGLSDFMAPPLQSEDKRQSIGILPVMNLGADIEEAVPSDYISVDSNLVGGRQTLDPRTKERQSLLGEIDEIRKSIDRMKNSTPAASLHGGDSRRVSTTSRPRSISQNLDYAMAGAGSARARVQSMHLLSDEAVGVQQPNQSQRVIGRTMSTPLRDEEWDSYVQERQLFQPPSGVSDPIELAQRPRSASMLLALPDSVQDAIAGRRRRESLFGLVSNGKSSPEDGALAQSDYFGGAPTEALNPKRRESANLAQSIQILPPQKRDKSADEQPEANTTRTFEELAERHKRKMRDLQNPLSQAEKEQAALLEAKNRWERSRQNEKMDFEQRQAEKLAAAAKSAERHSRRRSDQEAGQSRHVQQRSLTPDRLATINTPGGRRLSTAKVLEWQRYQQSEEDQAVKRTVSPPPVLAQGNNVPFPGGSTRPPREASSRNIRSFSRN